VHGHAGLHRAYEGIFDPGLAQDRMRLTGKGLGLAPLVACHRHQRPLGQDDRDNVGRAYVLSLRWFP
jgi:hypothetical protein